MVWISIIASLAVVTNAASVTLEHSFDGISFSPFAVIDLSPSTSKQGGELRGQDGSYPGNTFTRVELDGHAEMTASAAGAEAFAGSSRYYVRCGKALASVSSRCWAMADQEAEISLHLIGSDEHVGAITLRTPPCKVLKEDRTAISSKMMDMPRLSSVVVVRPLQAVEVIAPEVQRTLLEAPEKTEDAKETSKKDERGSSPPQKDERSWLQKNWLFVALSLFILANRLGQQEAPTAGGTASRGAPAPGRR